MPRDVARHSGWCFGVAIYPTANAAAKARKGMMTRKNAKRVKLEQFRCDRCHGWHLGSPYQGSKKEKQELRRRFLRDH